MKAAFHIQYSARGYHITDFFLVITEPQRNDIKRYGSP